MKKKPIISFSAMADFHCLGDRCEDTCCQDWDISFNKKHFNVLRGRIIDKGEDLSSFERNLSVSPCNTDKNYAQVIFDDNGACPFLDSSGLCQIHAEFGVDALSDVCTYFPRFFNQFKDHWEVSGSLSCPELARKTILGDKSFELETFDPVLLPRDHDFPDSENIFIDEDNAYLKYFALVRKTLLDILGSKSVLFETKLYALSILSNEISAYYYEGCNEAEVSHLSGDLKTFSSNLKLTHTQLMFDQYLPQDPIALIVVQAVLRLRIQRFPEEKLSKLIQASFEYYKAELINTPVLPDGNFPPDVLMKLYQAQADQLDTAFPELLGDVMCRYSQNSIFREMFTSMPNVFTYVHMLVVRVAMLKFLIVSHPEIIAILAGHEDKESQRELLEAKIIDVIYLFSRSIDHNSSFLEIIYFAIAEQEMMQFEFSLPYIKL